MRLSGKLVLLMLFCGGCAMQTAHSSGPFQASGIKIGEGGAYPTEGNIIVYR